MPTFSVLGLRDVFHVEMNFDFECVFVYDQI